MPFSNIQSTLLLLIPVLYLVYILYLAIYRLFFHSLRHIPGPISARISTWYTTYHDLLRAGQLPFAIKDLHDTYGPIVRITPNEVHISDPDFLDTIYAMRNRNAPYAGGLMIQQSIGGAEDWNLHKLRRDALSPYFSVKAVGEMGGLISTKAEKLNEILKSAAAGKDNIVNLSDAFFAYSNDVVRNFCFGNDNNLLADLQEAKTQRENLARLLTGVPLNKHFPWIGNILAKGLPMVLGKKAIPPAVMDLIRFRAKAGRDIEAILAEEGENKPDHSIFYDLRDSNTLPPEEKTIGRLQDEATLLIMAGTESPAKSLSIAAFYLVQKPEIISRLREELNEARGQESDLSLNNLLALPYLNAVAQEAHRLSFGVTRPLLRYSPTETLTYTASSGPHKGTSYVLPPATLMSSSTYSIHTDESLFPDAWSFEPDRWISDSSNSSSAADRSPEAVNRRKRYMISLGKGHRKCLGINLANAEMCLALSALAEYKMSLFKTDESDVKFQHDYQISHPRMGSKGVRVVVEEKYKNRTWEETSNSSTSQH